MTTKKKYEEQIHIMNETIKRLDKRLANLEEVNADLVKAVDGVRGSQEVGEIEDSKVYFHHENQTFIVVNRKGVKFYWRSDD